MPMGHLRSIGGAALLVGVVAASSAAQPPVDARPPDLEIPGGVLGVIVGYATYKYGRMPDVRTAR